MMLNDEEYRTRRCKWCKNLFQIPRKREYNNRQYCSDYCAKEAHLEKHRQAEERYRKRYKELIQLELKGYLLGEGRLGPHRDTNMEKELNMIRKELRRLTNDKGRRL